MKNPRMERLALLQRQCFRRYPWRLLQDGIMPVDSYEGRDPESLSYHEEVGFILNRRKIYVIWRHPRYQYYWAINTQALLEAGDSPQDWLQGWMDSGTKEYRRVGKLRKKHSGWTTLGGVPEKSAKEKIYDDRLRDITRRLSTEGIDREFTASWKWTRRSGAMLVELAAPMEVHNEADLASVALLARRLMLGQTTLEAEFPGYRYTRADWLREQEKMA